MADDPGGSQGRPAGCRGVDPGGSVGPVGRGDDAAEMATRGEDGAVVPSSRDLDSDGGGASGAIRGATTAASEPSPRGSPPAKRRKRWGEAGDPDACGTESLESPRGEFERAVAAALGADGWGGGKLSAAEATLKTGGEGNDEGDEEDEIDDEGGGEGSLPLAPSLDEYLRGFGGGAGGRSTYAPRPEWCRLPSRNGPAAPVAVAASGVAGAGGAGGALGGAGAAEGGGVLGGFLAGLLGGARGRAPLAPVMVPDAPEPVLDRLVGGDNGAVGGEGGNAQAGMEAEAAGEAVAPPALVPGEIPQQQQQQRHRPGHQLVLNPPPGRARDPHPRIAALLAEHRHQWRDQPAQQPMEQRQRLLRQQLEQLHRRRASLHRHRDALERRRADHARMEQRQRLLERQLGQLQRQRDDGHRRRLGGEHGPLPHRHRPRRDPAPGDVPVADAAEVPPAAVARGDAPAEVPVEAAEAVEAAGDAPGARPEADAGDGDDGPPPPVAPRARWGSRWQPLALPAPMDANDDGVARKEAGKEGGAGEEETAVFGVDRDSALHLAIKRGNDDAALELIRMGMCVNFPNAKVGAAAIERMLRRVCAFRFSPKSTAQSIVLDRYVLPSFLSRTLVQGITPLMLASQEGSLEVARELLVKGALPNATTIRGSTSLIQACHFGQVEVVEELLRRGAQVDQANFKNTTALMRASQEGHEDVVRLLLSNKAGVNRRNDERMTALMLSSQRGHASIVRILVAAGALLDAKTAQDSTSLMLACKRKHLDVARILVASGTELKLKDCKGRTVLETARRRGNVDFASILTDSAQVGLMQELSRKKRNFVMIRTWKLLQMERATIRLNEKDTTIHKVSENLGSSMLSPLCTSKRALVQAMTLPAPLIELISTYIPPPLILEKRLELLTSRSQVDPDSCILNAVDLIDEVLELGGILQAFDAAKLAPPSDFESWTSFQAWCGKCDVILSRCSNVDVANIFASMESTGAPLDDIRRVEPSADQRRSCNYLEVLARAPPSLSKICRASYDMPSTLFSRLRLNHDIQSLVRRLQGGGVHFDTTIATEIVVLARMTVMWCESRPIY
ncbi:hypothetical protein ACHAWF_018953 [Thalassiosira exigua]